MKTTKQVIAELEQSVSEEASKAIRWGTLIDEIAYIVGVDKENEVALIGTVRELMRRASPSGGKPGGAT